MNHKFVLIKFFSIHKTFTRENIPSNSILHILFTTTPLVPLATSCCSNEAVVVVAVVALTGGLYHPALHYTVKPLQSNMG